MNDAPLAVEPGKYRHSKSGKLYEVIGIALHTETEEPMVVYRPLYECDHSLFVRPAVMFMGRVAFGGTWVPRFEKINESEEA